MEKDTMLKFLASLGLDIWGECFKSSYCGFWLLFSN